MTRVDASAAAVTTMLSSGASYDGCSEAELAALLGLPRVVVFAEVPSTLDVAHDLAARGAPAGTLVLADAQTAGRGRFGRLWRSEPGAGVWLTVVARPLTAELSGVLSLRLALHLAAVLDAFVGGPVAVKWPNDLYAGERKLAGILLETRWRGERVDWLAAGVGINVEAPSGVSAAGLRPGSSRVAVLRAVIPAMRAALARVGMLTTEERGEFASRDVGRGRRCREPIEGIVAGIDATGALLVDTPEGRAAFSGGSLVFADANELTTGETP